MLSLVRAATAGLVAASQPKVTITKDYNNAFNVIRPLGVSNGGTVRFLAKVDEQYQCQDLCLAHRPRCNYFVYFPTDRAHGAHGAHGGGADDCEDDDAAAIAFAAEQGMQISGCADVGERGYCGLEDAASVCCATCRAKIVRGGGPEECYALTGPGWSPTFDSTAITGTVEWPCMDEEDCSLNGPGRACRGGAACGRKVIYPLASPRGQSAGEGHGR